METTLLACLGHRGPDGSGVFRDSRVTLAHTRLSIVDLLGGKQPLTSRVGDGDAALVANGEIYNFIELRKELTSLGFRFKTESDSEVILHAYLHSGVESLRRLNGMFAFALYDSRNGKLLLARDRLGIKPLYYARLGAGWVFASEIKSILPLLPSAPALDPIALTQFLEYNSHAEATGVFAGIHAVPPGTVMVFDANGEIQSHRYWDLAATPAYTGSEDDALEQFTALWDQVIREHVRSDVPYGLFLSGGIDSGTLAGTLSKINASPLQTFSVGFSGSEERSELHAARTIANLFGTRHQQIEIDPASLQTRYVEAIWATDDLMRDKAILPTLVLAEAASRQLKVVFTGEGGDEAFAGYGRYSLSLGRKLAALIDRKGGGIRQSSNWSANAISTCFGDALKRGRAFRRDAVVDAWRHTDRRWGNVRRRQYVDIQTQLLNSLLVKVDRSTMAYGLEARVPYLDHRVIEFGFSLPDKLKIRGDVRKYFLRRWAERYLPKDYLYKKKTGFGVPDQRILDPATFAAMAQLLPRARAIREWFDPQGVRKLLQQGRMTAELWSLVYFAVWHRLFVEGRGARPQKEISILGALGEG